MDSELPKRLFEEGAEPLGDKINKCARISILKVLATNIPSEYAEVKREPLFANIIAIHENRLHFSAKMVHSFLTRQLVTAKKHELWFVFARRPLRFSLQEFHAVTGLKCRDDGKSDLNNWDDDGGFWSQLLKSRRTISLETIRKKHINEANRWTRLDRLRLVYFCVVGLLVAVDEKTWVSHDYIKLIMDSDKLRAYPWGLRCFDHLVEGVIKARSDLSKTTSYVLQGFAYALQIWIMEAIPDCGTVLGKKLNDVDHICPRCSNWSGAARAGFVEIINLEKAYIKTGQGLVYSYISETGNMDVIDSEEFTRNDEMRDERVDLMKGLIGKNYDWSCHKWHFEEPVETKHAPVPAAGTESEVVHNEGIESGEDFRTPCGEATSSSASRTGKRKVIDKGAESRKKQLLFQRSVANAEHGSENFMRSLFDDYQKKMAKQSDDKYEKLASEFSQLKSDVSELKDMLKEALCRGNSGEPSSKSKPVPPISSQQRRQGHFDVSLDKLVDIDLTQSSDINFGENTQSYLGRKRGHLSQDSFVAGFDPSQQSKDTFKKPQQSKEKSKTKGKETVNKKKKFEQDTSKREGKAINTEAETTINKMEDVEEGSDSEAELLRMLKAITKPPPRLVYASDEERDNEDPLDCAEPVSELHPNKCRDIMVSKPYSQDPDAYLVYVSDERFEELQQWSFIREHLPVGPNVLTPALSERVIGGPGVWVENEEIDVMLYIFRENTSLKRWAVDRVGFMNFNFACQIKAAYEQWKSVKRKFELSEYILAFGKGILPAHGRTDKLWGVDVDRIYTPVCVGGNHWISLCISFEQRTIDVFDCNGLKRYREVDAFANMVPRILKEVQTDANKKHLSVAPYSVNYVPVRNGLNKTQCDCGIYALKYIECHVLGLDFSLLHDKNIKEARYKVLTDILQAAKDKVLLERMSKYEVPAFAPSDTVDVS